VRLASIQGSVRSKCYPVLDDAIARRMEVRLQYYSPARGKAGARVVEPRTLFTQSGRWYLAAWSVKDEKEKLFRLDRIIDVAVGARCFGQHKGAGVARTILFADADLHPEVEVRFSKKLARLAHEQFGAQARDNPDGSVTVKTRMVSEAYAVSWALGQGGAVRIVSPPAWQKALEKRAKELLSLHS
jgi:predicted DNA-binding transcriptional regulator YafY